MCGVCVGLYTYRAPNRDRQLADGGQRVRRAAPSSNLNLVESAECEILAHDDDDAAHTCGLYTFNEAIRDVCV